VAASITALKEAVRLFGPKQVRPKHILAKLPDLFGHSDKGVRAEASLLAVELHKWIGDAIEPTVALLKDIQAKELRAQFSPERSTVPERSLLSQRAVMEAAAAAAAGAGDEAGGDAEPAEAIDPLEFAEPTDPLKHADFPANFDELIVSKKWQERKEAVDALQKVLAATPKVLAANGLDSVVDALVERIKKDVNINVVLGACQCITGLANGLRTGFAKYKERALPPLLEKCKEKKESTVKVLAETLDAIFQTVSGARRLLTRATADARAQVTFGDILEDTLAATKHKNPAVKTEAIRFIARSLTETRAMPAKADIKPIAEALTAAMDDGSADVRDAGAQGLGTLMKLIGERPMNQFIDGLDDIKKGKVQEQFKVATVKVKAAPAARAPPAAAAAKPKAPVARVSRKAHP
jgi:cytoskeleton-associated protein 5